MAVLHQVRPQTHLEMDVRAVDEAGRSAQRCADSLLSARSRASEGVALPEGLALAISDPGASEGLWESRRYGQALPLKDQSGPETRTEMCSKGAARTRAERACKRLIQAAKMARPTDDPVVHPGWGYNTSNDNRQVSQDLSCGVAGNCRRRDG